MPIVQASRVVPPWSALKRCSRSSSFRADPADQQTGAAQIRVRHLFAHVREHEDHPLGEGCAERRPTDPHGGSISTFSADSPASIVSAAGGC